MKLYKTPLCTFARAVALASPLLLAACATKPLGTPEEQVRARATARWSQMMAKNFENAYTFASAGFKAVVKPEDYRKRFSGAGMWQAAEIVSVECEAPVKCKAVVRLDIRTPFAKRLDDKFPTHLQETWLLENGQWVLFENVKN